MATEKTNKVKLSVTEALKRLVGLQTHIDSAGVRTTSFDLIQLAATAVKAVVFSVGTKSIVSGVQAQKGKEWRPLTGIDVIPSISQLKKKKLGNEKEIENA